MTRERRGAAWMATLGMLIGCLNLAGCSWAYKRPTVTVAEVRLAAITLTGGSVLVQLDVMNPNRFALESRDFRYVLAFASGEGDEVRWTTLSEGVLADTVRVPAGGTGRVEARVPFDFTTVGAALGRLLRQGELEYRFSGELRAGTPLGGRRVPFDERGRIRP